MRSSRLWWVLALLPLGLGTCVLLIPMPHGGGTLGGNLLELWLMDFDEIERPAESVEGEQPVLVPRFAGVLTFEPKAAGPRWSAGSAGMRAAWLDESSGMLWGEREPMELMAGALDQEQMARAVSHCSSIDPPGYWSLPTDSEFAQARAADIADHVPDMQGRWLSQLILPNAVLPSIAGFGQREHPMVSVRCVARSEKAR